MLKHLKKEEMFQVNVLMTKEEKQKLQAQAKRFTGGNVSEWVRFSSLELKPDSRDLVKRD